jgi:NAD(P)-dependent dehydrogenase (short-subunit alcohol dehydrogenase family)
MNTLEDRVAVVTGAGSGIGLAMATALGRAGAKIVAADVQADALSSAVDELKTLGVEVHGALCDVSDEAAVGALASVTMERFGAVHVVCNNAGVAGAGDPWFGPISSWQWTMGVNFWGVVHGVRAFLPLIIGSGGGHIVNTASLAGLTPGFAPSYDASKHAVVAVTEDLFLAMRDAGLPVGVSCLCPGWVRTGILDSERNWPAGMGAAPQRDPGAEVMRGHVKRAIDEGLPPAAVADLVVDAVRTDRFWVFPHPEWVSGPLLERWHRIAEGLDPQASEQTPGLPPRTQLRAEVMAALGMS